METIRTGAPDRQHSAMHSHNLWEQEWRSTRHFITRKCQLRPLTESFTADKRITPACTISWQNLPMIVLGARRRMQILRERRCKLGMT